MVEDEKKQFKLLLDTMCESCEVAKFGKNDLKLWWTELNQFSLDDLKIKVDLCLEKNNILPTPADVIEVHKPTIKAKNKTPLTVEAGKKHAAELVDTVGTMKKRVDGRKWARDILANPSAYPDISLRYAKEALNVE